MMGHWGLGLTMRESFAHTVRNDRLKLFLAAQHVISIRSHVLVMWGISNFRSQSITYPIWIRLFACCAQDVLTAVT